MRAATTLIAFVAAFAAIVAAPGCAGAPDGLSTPSGAAPRGASGGAAVSDSRPAVVRSAAARSSSALAAANVVRFRGRNDELLPPFRALRRAVLRWRNSGVVFTLLDSRRVLLDSVKRSGSISLPRGRHRLLVIADGRWRLTIRPARLVRRAGSL